MAVLFCSADDDPVAWRRALREQIPGIDLRIWPDMGDPEEIEAALVWLPPPGLLAGLPQLRAVLSLGAGVDSLLADPTLPDVPLCRMVDPSMTSGMAELVLTLALLYHRRLDVYEAQQARRLWRMVLPQPASATRVGIMGLGELGGPAARLLARHGFTVRGWCRAPRQVEGVTVFAGEGELEGFLRGSDILVCMLPLTAGTEGILCARTLAQLPRGARLINVARGRHLVEADLLAALDDGQLAHATLDVFRTEPLPAEHAFWAHPRIRVLPHTASYSQAEIAAEVVAENLRRLESGRPLVNLVDRQRGY
ncbi:MAG TPA: glyoxylate/hydroxypyruvate reductase A [Geminicoccaceae bacterium]|nr:glyoxylate/hydroxypyruvate reductase A [Geminicoccus sp.]HMU52080.1 glyoxylate/hydroxypyruvate reductase A [Geminicoccaceae bacterium]